jgi:type III secretion system YscD/HrpQ family protein
VIVGELQLTGGEKETETRFSFDSIEKKWVLGSDPTEAKFLIEDPSVADQHLAFSLVDGSILVQNLVEPENTLFNGEPLVAPEVLSDGDELKIGDLLLKYNQVSKEPDQDMQDNHRESIFGEITPEGVSGIPEVHFDLLEGSRFILKVVGGPNSGAEFPLLQDHTYTIGTDSQSADIVFQDVSVSRQHARLSLNEDGTLLLTDLGSRNGTFIEDNKIQGEITLPPNKVVTLGTSSFIVVDNEGDRSTIISPLLPSIVKVLQKQGEKTPLKDALPPPPEPATPSFSILGAFILIAVLSALFAIVGLGVRSLLKTEEVEKTQDVDVKKKVEQILVSDPDVRFSYNEKTGRLLLIGHVLTNVEHSELLLGLQSISAIRSVDDNVIVDEFVWQQTNETLSQNPEWKGISMFSPSPGVYTLTGIVQKRRQLDSLIEYMNQNFNFPEHLEYRVVVEEDLINQASSILRNRGFQQVKVAFSEGQLRLSGTISKDQEANFKTAVTELAKLPGVRTLQNLVLEQRVEGMTNLTSRYKVSGVLGREGGKTSVVINGRILAVGDSIDGMNITSITQDGIYLEKDGEKFKIDYNR